MIWFIWNIQIKLDLPFICLFIGSGPFPQMPLCPMQGCPKFFFGAPHYILWAPKYIAFMRTPNVGKIMINIFYAQVPQNHLRLVYIWILWEKIFPLLQAVNHDCFLYERPKISCYIYTRYTQQMCLMPLCSNVLNSREYTVSIEQM